MSKCLFNIIRGVLIFIILFVISTLCFDLGLFSEFFSNKIVFILFLVIPFLILLSLEIFSILRGEKLKKLSMVMDNQLDIFNKIGDNSELGIATKNSIESQINLINNYKNDYKKINELEKTMQISLGEIEEGLRRLNEKNSLKDSDDDSFDDTMVLFDNKDIKDEIREELEIKKENISKKNWNKV